MVSQRNPPPRQPPPGQLSLDLAVPTLVPRARDAAREDERDRELLGWIARFRFVDAGVIAAKSGVSRRQVNARLARLQAAGLVRRTCRRDAPSTGATTSVTRKGMRAIGLEVRRAARTDVQREHELALAWLVAKLEARGAVVRTERECRALERETGERYSADVQDAGGATAKRWPDLVLERDDGATRIALELERTAKGAARIGRIIDGYDVAPWFDEVRLLACDPGVARLLARTVAASEPHRSPAIVVGPWPGLPPARRDAVTAALSAA